MNGKWILLAHLQYLLVHQGALPSQASRAAFISNRSWCASQLLQPMLALSTAPLLAHQMIASATVADQQSGPPLMSGSITDVPGIKIGHHTLTRPRLAAPSSCVRIALLAALMFAARPLVHATSTCLTRPTRSSKSKPFFSPAGAPMGWRPRLA